MRWPGPCTRRSKLQRQLTVGIARHGTQEFGDDHDNDDGGDVESVQAPSIVRLPGCSFTLII